MSDQEQRQGYIDIEGLLAEHVKRYEESEQSHEERWCRLENLLEGEPVIHFDGSVSHNGGLVQEVHQLNKFLRNGGIKYRLAPGQVAIISASIMATGGIIAAAIAG